MSMSMTMQAGTLQTITGSLVLGEIYAGSRHLATYDNVPQQTVFVHNDWQGTERVRSKYDGSSYETCTNLPYGDSQTCTVAGGANDPSPLHYTGKMRDVETNLDYFGARYYSSGMAHWMSPDWADMPTSVPYANFGDPQTLNLYAYVSGSPVSGQDSDGHFLTLAQSEGAGEFGMGHGGASEALAEPPGEQTGGVGKATPPVTVAGILEKAMLEFLLGALQSSSSAQQQSSEQAPDNTLLAQNNTPPPPGRTPAQGATPDSTVVIPDGKGGSTTRTYGPDGKAVVDIDKGHDHGAGDPHAHDWDWGKKPPRQPGRPLTPEEKAQVANGVKKATFWGTVGVVTYWVVSEGSRILFPPRNLIPVP